MKNDNVNVTKIEAVDCQDDIKELADESALKAHCQKLDEQGVRYEITDIPRRLLSA